MIHDQRVDLQADRVPGVMALGAELEVVDERLGKEGTEEVVRGGVGRMAMTDFEGYYEF